MTQHAENGGGQLKEVTVEVVTVGQVSDIHSELSFDLTWEVGEELVVIKRETGRPVGTGYVDHRGVPVLGFFSQIEEGLQVEVLTRAEYQKTSTVSVKSDSDDQTARLPCNRSRSISASRTP